MACRRSWLLLSSAILRGEPFRGRNVDGPSCRTSMSAECSPVSSVHSGSSRCRWCLPTWRSRGWWCRRCRQGIPTVTDERLCGRPLVIVADDGDQCGPPRVIGTWQPIPFATVGELVGFLAEVVVDHPPAAMTFRIGTRIFMHPTEPSWRSRTVLWALDPGLAHLSMYVRAVVPGGDGTVVRLRLRPGPPLARVRPRVGAEAVQWAHGPFGGPGSE